MLAPCADGTVMVGYKFFDTLVVHGDQAPIGRLIPRLGVSVVAPDQGILSELSLKQVVPRIDAKPSWVIPVLVDVIIQAAEGNSHTLG